MLKFPCPDCPVYIMCKNRLYSLPSQINVIGDLFVQCPPLNSYLFEDIDNTETGKIMVRLNIARVFYGLVPIFKWNTKE